MTIIIQLHTGGCKRAMTVLTFPWYVWSCDMETDTVGMPLNSKDSPSSFRIFTAAMMPCVDWTLGQRILSCKLAAHATVADLNDLGAHKVVCEVHLQNIGLQELGDCRCPSWSAITILANQADLCKHINKKRELAKNIPSDFENCTNEQGLSTQKYSYMLQILNPGFHTQVIFHTKGIHIQWFSLV